MTTGLFALLAVIALALVFLFASVASVFVQRLRHRPTLPISEEIGSAVAVIKKARKREPMTQEELEYARRIVADRSSFGAFCIPATLFALGSFYVFGSLEHLHGATPSERTFIGVIPMLTSTNLAIRLLSSAKLKGRLRKMTPTAP